MTGTSRFCERKWILDLAKLHRREVGGLLAYIFVHRRFERGEAVARTVHTSIYLHSRVIWCSLLGDDNTVWMTLESGWVVLCLVQCVSIASRVCEADAGFLMHGLEFAFSYFTPFLLRGGSSKAVTRFCYYSDSLLHHNWFISGFSSGLSNVSSSSKAILPLVMSKSEKFGIIPDKCTWKGLVCNNSRSSSDLFRYLHVIEVEYHITNFMKLTNSSSSFPFKYMYIYCIYITCSVCKIWEEKLKFYILYWIYGWMDA